MLKLTPKFAGIAVLLGALSPCLAMADSPTLANILPGDYDSVTKEFSANFAYSSVTPASSLGGLWGLEFGIVGGESTDPNLKNLVATASPGTNFPSHLYHAELLARLGLPYGFTVEAMMFPKKTVSSLTLMEYGGAVQWTPTDSILDDLPVNLAAKFSLNKAKVNFTQNATVSGAATVVPVGVEYNDTEWALTALASMKFLVFEPYVTAGYVKSKGTLDLSTNGFNVNFFSQNFPVAAQSNHAESSPTSMEFTAGVDLRLAVFTLGAEYMRVFGCDVATGRLSFRF
jgi:hypothetical protein